MSEAGWTTGAALVVGALAAASSLSPDVDRAVTTGLLVLLALGVLAGLGAYRTHVLRIRREIEVRGGTVLRRVDPPPHSRPGESCGPRPGRSRRSRSRTDRVRRRPGGPALRRYPRGPRPPAHD